MDGRRLTGPRACGSLFEKSKLATPPLIATVTASLIGLVEHDPIAVEQTLGGRFAFRQFGDGRAQFIRRALEDGGEGVGHRGRAEARAQVLDPRRTHLRHRDLGVDVAGDQHRLSAVGEDDAFDIGLRDAARPRS